MLRKKIELAVSCFVVAMLAWALWETRAWPPQSQIFPRSIGLVVLGLALVQLVTAVKNILTFKALEEVVPDRIQSFVTNAGANHSRQGDAAQNMPRRKVIIVQLWIIIFFSGIWLLGFKIGALVLTLAFLKIAAHERWAISASFALMSYLFFLLIFDFALGVPLEAGLIADYLELNSLDMYLVEPFLNLLRGVM